MRSLNRGYATARGSSHFPSYFELHMYTAVQYCSVVVQTAGGVLLYVYCIRDSGHCSFVQF